MMRLQLLTPLTEREQTALQTFMASSTLSNLIGSLKEEEKEAVLTLLNSNNLTAMLKSGLLFEDISNDEMNEFFSALPLANTQELLKTSSALDESNDVIAPLEQQEADDSTQAQEDEHAIDAVQTQPQPKKEFEEVLKGVVKELFNKAHGEITERKNKEKSAIKKMGWSTAERLLVPVEKKADEILDQADRYEGQVDRIVEIINDAVPVLTKIFGGESSVVKLIPEEAKHEEFITPLENLGAENLTKLIRLSMK